MSYILDALQKSEQERHRGSVPNLQSVQISTGAPAGKRRYWIPLLTILLVSGAAIFGYQSQLQPTEIPDHATQPLPQTASTLKPAAAPVVKKPAILPSHLVAAPQNPDPVTAEKVPAKSSLNRVTEKPVILLSKPIQKLPDSEAARKESISDALPESSTQQWQKITPSSSPPVAAVKKSSSVKQAQVVAASKPLLPTLAELPAATQSSLPAIRISAHIYSDKPASRMVIINTKTMREGQAVAGGLILQKITREGVIFQFQGTRFRMSKLKVWRKN